MMKSFTFSCVTAVLFVIFQAQAHPGGAPTEACETLLPQHNESQSKNNTLLEFYYFEEVPRWYGQSLWVPRFHHSSTFRKQSRSVRDIWDFLVTVQFSIGADDLPNGQ